MHCEGAADIRSIADLLQATRPCTILHLHHSAQGNAEQGVLCNIETCHMQCLPYVVLTWQHRLLLAWSQQGCWGVEQGWRALLAA